MDDSRALHAWIKAYQNLEKEKTLQAAALVSTKTLGENVRHEGDLIQPEVPTMYHESVWTNFDQGIQQDRVILDTQIEAPEMATRSSETTPNVLHARSDYLWECECAETFSTFSKFCEHANERGHHRKDAISLIDTAEARSEETDHSAAVVATGRWHGSSIPAVCVLCGSTFADLLILQQHESSEHESCGTCALKFVDCVQLVLHCRKMQHQLPMKIHSADQERLRAAIRSSQTYTEVEMTSGLYSADPQRSPRSPRAAFLHTDERTARPPSKLAIPRKR